MDRTQKSTHLFLLSVWNSLVSWPNLKEYPYGPDGSQAVGSHPVVLPPGHAGSERETDGFSATWHRRRTSSNSFFKSRLDLDRGCLSVTISACTMHTASLIQISKAVLDTKKLRWSLLRGLQVSLSLFRGFTARTLRLPDWSDLFGDL